MGKPYDAVAHAEIPVDLVGKVGVVEDAEQLPWVQLFLLMNKLEQRPLARLNIRRNWPRLSATACNAARP